MVKMLYIAYLVVIVGVVYAGMEYLKKAEPLADVAENGDGMAEVLGPDLAQREALYGQIRQMTEVYKNALFGENSVFNRDSAGGNVVSIDRFKSSLGSKSNAKRNTDFGEKTARGQARAPAVAEPRVPARRARLVTARVSSFHPSARTVCYRYQTVSYAGLSSRRFGSL